MTFAGLVVLEYPGIHGAGVVGQPDDRAGHVPIAYLVCDPDVTAAQLDS